MECPVCFDSDADTLACQPMLHMGWDQKLCSHSFCLECLQTYLRGAFDDHRRIIPCPLCPNLMGHHDFVRIVGHDVVDDYVATVLAPSYEDRVIDPGALGPVKVYPCPKCNVLVSKDAGCHIISCRCGWTFPWPGAPDPGQELILIPFTLLGRNAWALPPMTPVSNMIDHDDDDYHRIWDRLGPPAVFNTKTKKAKKSKKSTKIQEPKKTVFDAFVKALKNPTKQRHHNANRQPDKHIFKNMASNKQARRY